MDWAGSWFTIVERLGESMRIITAVVDSNGIPKWTVFDHTKMDGIGAATQSLLGPEARPPESMHQKSKPAPGSFRVLLAILKHIRSRSQKTRWKNYDPTKVGSSPALAWTNFDAAATKELKSFALSQKVSINTFLLAAFDQSVRKHFVDGGQTRWSIPVNMRGLTSLSHEVGNQLSFVNVNFDESQTLVSYHSKIRAKFTDGNHWANWALMHIGKYIGSARAEAIYKSAYDNPNPETGTFSSLGEWSSDLINADESFVFSAPSSKLTPIVGGVAIVNGKLSLAVQIHPSLNPTIDSVANTLKAWTTEIMQMAKLASNAPAVSVVSTQSILAPAESSPKLQARRREI